MNDESFDEKIIMGDLNEGVDCGEQSFGPRELFSGGGGGRYSSGANGQNFLRDVT